MLLYPNLPEEVIIDGVAYAINTRYYIILKILEYTHNKELSDSQKVIYSLKLFYKKSWGEDINKAVEAMWKFIELGNYPSSYKVEEKQEPCLDYVKDNTLIWASMTQTYGSEWKNWHWLEWKAAFDNLPETSPINKVIGYRLQVIDKDMNADEKKRISKLKAIYSLGIEKKKRTSSEVLEELRALKKRRLNNG